MIAAQYTIRKERGHIVVQAIGRTARGQSYIKRYKVLGVKSIDSPDFKAQMAAAVKEMDESTE